MDALNLGVRPGAFVIRDLIRHEQSGLLVDPKPGKIYGAWGTPIGAICADGYVRLGGRRKGYLYAHRLIWETVHGPIPPGLYIDHLNGRKADNRIANLDAVTPSENAFRAIAAGLVPVGEARAQAKLTDGDVRAIRRTVGEVPTREWARRLGVDPAVVRAVRHGRTWRHVSQPARRHRKRPSHGRSGSNRPDSRGGWQIATPERMPKVSAGAGEPGERNPEGDA